MSRGLMVRAGCCGLCILWLTAAANALEQWDSLGLADPNVRCVAVAPGDSALLVAGGANLYVSDDDAVTWDVKSNVSGVWCIGFGSSKNLAFAGTWGSGVYRSTDGCNTWEEHSAGLGSGVVTALCVDPSNDLVAYAASQAGLYRSANGGDAWTPSKTGISATAVAVSPAQPQTVYLGAGDSSVWRSLDGGGNWTRVGIGSLPNNAAEVSAIAFEPGNAAIIYVAFRFKGAWVSFDAGDTWAQIPPEFEGFAVSADRVRPGFVYGVGGWTTPKRSGCHGGANGWADMKTGWGGWFARFIAVDPNDPARVYASGNGFGLVRWVADTTAPVSPSKLTAVAMSNAIRLSWTPSSTPDCAGYWIYRRAGADPHPIIPAFFVAGAQAASFSDSSVIAGNTYYYQIAAVDGAQNRGTLSTEASAQITANYDLDVSYITRLPRDNYYYVVDYPDSLPTLRSGTQNDKRWPAPGETVTWQAHFVNKGTAATPPANYRWKIDGQVVGTGTAASVAPGQEGTANLNWLWNIEGLDTDHTDQTLSFEIDYDNQIPELFEQNNSLTDFLEGLAIWIYVERPIYEAFNARSNLVGTKSFEDWIQAQFKSMNDNFARSTYPLAPRGCLERVRIDNLVVGPVPPRDRVPDGVWQFTGDPGYADWAATRVDGGLIHELMHQLGIIDLYNLPVSPPHNAVLTPDGLPVGMGFGFGRGGIMAGGDIAPHSSGATQFMPEYCSSHDVLGLNSNVGYRRGYYGEYMFDIPANNYIIVKDSAGNPAAGVTVKVYQGGGGSMSATPVATGTTDAEGRFLLPNRPPVRVTTTATGHTIRANPFGTINVVGHNGTLLIEMSRPGGDFDYRFMSIIDFNLAYWSGNTEEWTYHINSRLAANNLPRITGLNAAINASSVHLVWPAVAGASSYRVYRASSYLNRADDPQHLYENWVFRPIATVTGTSYTDTTRFETCRYAVAPVAGTEGPLSNRVFAPNLINPWGVAILPDDQRVVLDPQNGFAFLRQTSDGVYVANTGSEHNHVEYSHFLAIDNRLNRMLTSHPGDWYNGPHSIRITNVNGDLTGLWDLGSQGSGPGQFNNPAGVAVDEASRIYAVDNGNRRIQVFTSSGSFLTAFGAAGAGNGQFNDPQGIAVGADHKLYVCDRGNRRVQILRYRPETNAVEFVGLLTGKAMNAPTGVALAATGEIFVTDSGNNSVERYAASGVWSKSHITALAPYSGNLSNPTGIAVDGLGQVIVCDTSNRRVVTVVAAVEFNPADFNRDGKVDQLDLGLFRACMTGAGVRYDGSEDPPSQCTLTPDQQGYLPADFDRDRDIDQDDFGGLQRCFGGVSEPAPANCAQGLIPQLN